MPSDFVVKNGSNSSPVCAGGTPAPRSTTRRRTCSRVARSTSTSTTSPPGEASTALRSRLSTARARRSASPVATAAPGAASDDVHRHAAQRGPGRERVGAPPRELRDVERARAARARAPTTMRRSATRPSRRAISAEACAMAPVTAGGSGGASPAGDAARSRRSLIDASGLRTSWATPATTRPSAARRSLPRELAREALLRLPRLGEAARQRRDAVADGGELAHGRPRHGRRQVARERARRARGAGSRRA